ncbi:uncharacterized protein LOC143274755 [Babylonia areolata]|uniref:uncharacterized protein LOC143274755 n=1 Tax=Babylonia areolata TaxID=304850 RepID=UPI003FD25F1E
MLSAFPTSRWLFPVSIASDFLDSERRQKSARVMVMMMMVAAAAARTVPVLVSTTLLLALLLPPPHPLLSAPPALLARADPVAHSWRYVFPFFPAELDILVGHLRTTVTRLQEVLKQCEDMRDGEWEGDNGPLGVQMLSADEDDKASEDLDKAEDLDDSMEDKVERIVELREVISDLEDKIEECAEED